MTSRFPPSSRYALVAITQLASPDGPAIPYLKRRFVPAPERFESVGEHPVTHGDRLDNLAAVYFEDPELFWRLCDANRALRPDELIEQIGRRLRITLPIGLGGV